MPSIARTLRRGSPAWYALATGVDGPTPRFVKAYADLRSVIDAAIRAYADDVRRGGYPEPRHTYGMPEAEQDRFASGAGAGKS